jgi:hypothetical protein
VTSSRNNLAKRAVLGLIQLQLFLAVLLFLPAWSLRFWQAWIYWVLSSVSVLFITLYFLEHDPALVERRMAAGPAVPLNTFRVMRLIASGFDID